MPEAVGYGVLVLRFSFGLRPVAEVPPWGSHRPNLHWFGRTSGY